MMMPSGLERQRGSGTALTVTELVSRIKGAVEASPGRTWVRGEVSSLKVHGSGHWYFTLRDLESCIRCVMWKTYTVKVAAQPADGTEVFVLGNPTIWEARGELRLPVVVMLPTAGVGLQQLAKERVRTALEQDGLLDPARKRSLPALPRGLAVITSEDGAALQDILNVARRRWPMVRLVIVPAKVQGEEAPGALVRAIAAVNRIEGVDICVIGRGGGAREDLAAFDDERVCRAVAGLRMPSISAVGHETDVTLTDLVADVRAATPSAAMELALPDQGEWLRRVGALGARLARGLSQRTVLVEARLARTGDRLRAAIARHLTEPRARLDRMAGQLEALSPLRVLGRGYSLARLANGTVVRRRSQLPGGTRFSLRVGDGEVGARSEG
ncbi:MAG TPA: exodeoxyribonuclease VII large subunit [Gemmatimonadales bacterium]|nr:exodeoxyribonuclease VII large subunit [Gemmatimonadales bacterium]